MLKNIGMRILAISFALALVGCVADDGITPLGVDDIEEAGDDLGPDNLKDTDDADQLDREIDNNTGEFCTGPLCNTPVATGDFEPALGLKAPATTAIGPASKK